MSIYTESGYTSRRDYLESLAEDFGLPKETVFVMASMLGPDEDFDGLISMLDDESYRQSMRQAVWGQSIDKATKEEA